MKKRTRILAGLPVALAALMLGAGAPVAWAGDEEAIPFDEAEIFFELNNTDGDLGIHALIDGDAWKQLKIYDSKRRKLLKVGATGRLRRQGLTEIFFESAEPRFESDDPDETTLTPEEFFARFPPGEYEIWGKTLEGDKLESETEVTHVMPAPPVTTVNSEPMALVCDEDDPDFDAPEVTAPVTIEWAEVMSSHPDLGVDPPIEVTIHNYQIVVEAEVEINGDEFVSELSVILPPDARSFTIPEEFTEQTDQFKYEVLAREVSFNQTAVESCFVLEE